MITMNNNLICRFRDWLPRLRGQGAFFLLLSNIFFPGIGTALFSLKWLNGEDFAVPTTMKPRWSVASIGVLYGLAQFILAPFLFGWAWAIFTGIMAVRQSKWIDLMDQKEKYMREKAANAGVSSGGAMLSIEEAGEGDEPSDETQKKMKSVVPPYQPPRRKKAPTPPPESPPPGWVYRLYPYPVNAPEEGERRGNSKAGRRSNSRLSQRVTPRTTSQASLNSNGRRSRSGTQTLVTPRQKSGVIRSGSKPVDEPQKL